MRFFHWLMEPGVSPNIEVTASCVKGFPWPFLPRKSFKATKNAAVISESVNVGVLPVLRSMIFSILNLFIDSCQDI